MALKQIVSVLSMAKTIVNWLKKENLLMKSL